jgi:hypothetical protein
LSIRDGASSAWKLFTPTDVVGAGVHLGQLGLAGLDVGDGGLVEGELLIAPWLVTWMRSDPPARGWTSSIQNWTWSGPCSWSARVSTTGGLVLVPPALSASELG